MKTISILGSTGSIGRQTLEVASEFKNAICVHSLAAATNVAVMEEQVRAFRPLKVAMVDENAARELKGRLCDLAVKIVAGMEGLLELVTDAAVDTVVNAVSGRIGLEPTLAALEAGKDVALANKETLVAAGEIVMQAAKRCGRAVLPVDSEHSAIFQCLEEDRKSVSKLILTASGGPFLHTPLEELAAVTPEQALNHPNWVMGAKITIDSATMMNKGLEIIEAHHLFQMDYDQIEVLIHPQSIVHSMVEYHDGSVIAQLGRPDMRLPIQYALSYPKRWPNSFERLNLRGQCLTFIEPEPERFPALALAYRVGRQGGTLPAVMNAANEVAVTGFLQRKIGFLEIVSIVEQVCEEHHHVMAPTLQEIIQADLWARERTAEILAK